MKIAIASNDGQTIASHFGRTKGFVIVEVEGKKVKTRDYRPNTFTPHARGLEGDEYKYHEHGPLLNALSDCAVVISHGMGRRLYDDLATAGVRVFVTHETDMQRALDLYLNGQLDDRPELRHA
ncbi:MAG: iron-molybdenum cofactor biosynthesis protein [Acidobacteria bacterium]|nr:iron-molybdenum cofactor biosynthesis protein [Acidobacteriota bacterium]